MSHLTTRQSGKSNVLLTELVIVILFFALTAATSMQLFVASHRKSQQNVMINRASIIAQDLAEILSGQDAQEALLRGTGFEETGPGQFTRSEGDNITKAALTEEPTEAGKLLLARIEVYNGSGETQPLAQLTAATYLPNKEAP